MAWIHPPALGCRFSFLHLPCGRCGHTSVVHSNYLFIFGGFEGKKWLNDLHKFDTTSFVWSQPRVLGTAPQPRQYHTAVAVNGFMYIFGGYNGAGWLKDLVILDLNSYKWTYPKTSGDVPSGREGHSMVFHEGFLYIFGGWDGGTIGDLYRINIQNFIWGKIEISGEKPLLCGHSSTCLENKLYIFGGFDGVSWTNSLFQLDFEKFTCEKLKTKGKPVARGYHTTTLVNKYLLVYAGYNGKFILGDLLALDIENLTWSLPDPCLGHFPSARNAHTMSIIGSEIFLFGGYNGTRDINDLHVLETAAFSTIQDDLKSAIGFPEGNKTYISVSSQTLAVHNVILKVRCPQLLSYKSLNLSNQSLKALIEYLYCDSATEKISSDQRPELLSLSTELNLPRLKSLCEDDSEILETTLTADIMKTLSLIEESDFVVAVEGKDFPLHKIILAARCPYFRSMFASCMAETLNNRVEFPDFKLSAFEYVVEWIYSDKFSPLFGDTQLETAEFIQILMQSNMLGLESLMRMTELAAEKIINIENVVQLFEVCHYLGAARLKSYSINFILKEFENIILKRELSQISESAFDEINQYLPKRVKRQSSNNGIFPPLSLIKLDKGLCVKPHDPKCNRPPSQDLNGVFSFRNPVNNLEKDFRSSSPCIKKAGLRKAQRAFTVKIKEKIEPAHLLVQGVSARGNHSVGRSPVLKNVGLAISSSLGSLYQKTLNEGLANLLYK